MFVNDVNTFIKDSLLKDDQVFNADQSGFSFEIHSRRNLQYLGYKEVESQIQSLNALTHSYRIIPIIIKSGLRLRKRGWLGRTWDYVP